MSLLRTDFRSGTSTANRPRKNNGRKKKRIDDSDSEPRFVHSLGYPTTLKLRNLHSNNMKIDDFLNYISSKDAYMLIYARRDASASRDASQPLLVPPKAARERVANLNKKHEDACTAFAEWWVCSIHCTFLALIDTFYLGKNGCPSTSMTCVRRREMSTAYGTLRT